MRTLAMLMMMFGVGGAVLAGDERNVIVPADDDAFVVEKTDYVRLTGKGISGSRTEIKVDGPAKVDSISNVQTVKGGLPMIGNSTKQFDLKPTGTGKVTVTITVASPIPGTNPEIRKIGFEVK